MSPDRVIALVAIGSACTVLLADLITLLGAF